MLDFIDEYKIIFRESEKNVETYQYFSSDFGNM